MFWSYNNYDDNPSFSEEEIEDIDNQFKKLEFKVVKKKLRLKHFLCEILDSLDILDPNKNSYL